MSESKASNPRDTFDSRQLELAFDHCSLKSPLTVRCGSTVAMKQSVQTTCPKNCRTLDNPGSEEGRKALLESPYLPERIKRAWAPESDKS